MKEYLDPDNGYALITVDDDIKGGSGWVKIPEGAEIAIRFKTNPDEYGIVFYKNSGKSCVGKGDNNWQHDSEWTMDQLLNENYHDGGIDLSHDVLWQRPAKPEELPFIDDEPKYTDDEVKYMDKNGQGRLQSINDQYAEIEQVRQQTIKQTLAERGSRYGDYSDVASTTQQLIAIIECGASYEHLNAEQKTSLFMICNKIARAVNGDPNYIENWHDIAGYSTLIESSLMTTEGATNSKIVAQRVVNGVMEDI